ncbi:MAG: MFS transporter [Planctomycetota bacterium]|nr:MFS transporter [Planctomycetota bacterium]MDA0934736.1 MFS transporter [Planctomycetota bacterium]MDA1222309.1 MFS transporter [Planctomycetota bacterium]
MESRRNFLAVWPSLFVVSMGLMAFVPMLPLYIAERFGIQDPIEQRRWAGWVYGAAPLAAAVCGPFWGVLGDRIGRKPMALRAMLGIAVVTALMPMVETPLGLLLARVAQGALAGYVAPAMVLGTVDVPVERQGRALGQLQVGMALGLLAGPVVGAEVTAWFGRTAVFYVTSVSALASAAVVAVFARENLSMLRADAGRGIGFIAEARRLLGSRAVAAVLLCVFLMRLGSMMVEAFVALWVDELGPLEAVVATTTDGRSHAVDRTVALMFATYAVGQLLLTAAWGRLGDRFGPLRCLAVIAVGLGLAQALAGVWQTIDGFFVARVIAAVFAAGAMNLSYAALAKRVSADQRSLAFACVQSGMQYGMFLGPLAGTAIATLVGGLGGLFVVSGVILVVVGVAMLAARRMEA